MQPLYVVILQSDGRIAKSVASALSDSFRSIEFASSLVELRELITGSRVGIAILDMEVASLSEVQSLARDFPRTSIVCTHRLADEDMWTAALSAGAVDICSSSDVSAIVRSAIGSARIMQSAAAA